MVSVESLPKGKYSWSILKEPVFIAELNFPKLV